MYVDTILTAYKITRIKRQPQKQSERERDRERGNIHYDPKFEDKILGM